MKYYVDIDQKKCINCFACYLINKNIFGVKNGKIVLKKKTITKREEIEDLIKAANACPVKAIFYINITEQ
ncbi:MAG: 4Fe-4S domain-containing protein [Nanopusillaceae archaeon]